MTCKDDVLFHKLQCGPFSQWAFRQGTVACIIKTFALQPAVGLSTWCGRVQHSRLTLAWRGRVQSFKTFASRSAMGLSAGHACVPHSRSAQRAFCHLSLLFSFKP
eukprot:810849-Rhodomonas_salina.1